MDIQKSYVQHKDIKFPVIIQQVCSKRPYRTINKIKTTLRKELNFKPLRYVISSNFHLSGSIPMSDIFSFHIYSESVPKPHCPQCSNCIWVINKRSEHINLFKLNLEYKNWQNRISPHKANNINC